jgi:serine/threonine-protein phosphatase 2A regulatory subunit A
LPPALCPWSHPLTQMEQENIDIPDELYPLALLMDELKHDEFSLRISAMKKLQLIAAALRQERCRDELIPFLEDVTQEDEDEVLTVLAEELANLVPYIGGPEYSHLLIPSLETLSCMEEPVVRDKAVESINRICEGLPSRDHVAQTILPLVKRLSSAEWFSSKVSATGLYAAAIRHCPTEAVPELLKQYGELTRDDTPMVRRAAATHLPAVIEALPAEADSPEADDEIYSMFKAQVGDDQDSVRLLSVNVLIAKAEKLKRQGNSQHTSSLIEFALALLHDPSWRVRYMCADRFEKLAESLTSVVPEEGVEKTEVDEMERAFVPEFIKFMQDGEAEVRTAVAKQVPGFCRLVTPANLDKIVANVEELSQDSSQHVRAALGSEISALAPLLGKEKTIETLLPTFLQMLKDDFPDVRLNIISKLHLVNKVIGIDLLSQSLLPAVSDLAQDKQWRVRLAIIEYIPLLATQLGVSFFDKELGPLCMTWLWDSVYSIREAATQNLKKLTKVFGVDWAKDEILPHIIVVAADSNYLYRLTALCAVTTLIPVVDESMIKTSILPFIAELINDPIPNIRFNVAKTYTELVRALHEEKISSPEVIEEICTSTVIPHLERLSTDGDVDVRYFSTKALEDIAEIKKAHA